MQLYKTTGQGQQDSLFLRPICSISMGEKTTEFFNEPLKIGD